MHYTIQEVEAKIADWMILGCIPKAGHEYLKGLVDRANSAEDSQRRYEHCLARLAGASLVDIAEAENATR